MRILALDAATRTGFCFGDANGAPADTRSGAARLKQPDEPAEVAAFNAACLLRDQWFAIGVGAPDLVVIEDYLNPVGQPSADAVIVQLQLHGAINAAVRGYGCRIEKVAPATWRKHFVGTARLPKGSPKDELKRMSLRRAILLGYLPRDCKDLDRAEACGIWDYAVGKFARTPAARFELFEGRP